MTKQEKIIIIRIIEILKDRYRSDPSGHDWAHLERVWKMAKRLAKGTRVNQFVLELSALLHDVDDYKFKKEEDDELSGTKKLLDAVGVKRKDREYILDIVKNVSFKGAGVPTVQTTLEGNIVQDADRLEALGAIGIARVFAYGGSAGHPYYDPTIKPLLANTFHEYKNRKKTTINHFYEKLLLLKDRINTPQAKKVAKHRHTFLEEYLTEFFAEVEGNR